MNNKYKVGIIVVSYHNPTMTIRFVKDELSKLKFPFILVVVNNDANREESLDLAEKCGLSFVDEDGKSEIPDYSKFLIWSPKNLGYAKGNNKGVAFLNRIGGFTHFLFSNDDIEIRDSDILENLSAIMNSHPKIGIVGPRIVGLDGREQSPHDSYISPYRQIGWKLLKPFRKKRKQNNMAFEPVGNSHPRTTYWVCGAFMMVRADAFNQVGGFDKRTFLYYEEVILAEIFRNIGLGVMYVPSCSVIHFEGGSSKNTPSKRSLQISKESSLVYYKYYRHVNSFALMLYKLIC